MEKRVKALIDFSALVLRKVVEKRVSHDRAFQAALDENPKPAKLLPLKTLYRASRAMVSDYYLLRYMEEKIYGASGGTRRLARLWLLYRADSEPSLEPLWDGVERLRRRLNKTLPKKIESVEELIEAIEDPVEKLAVKHSFPRWFVERLVKLLGLGEAEELLRGLNEEHWWIRVNTLKADVDTIAERLYEKGVVTRRDPHLPYMLEVLDYTQPLHRLEEMWRGEIVFQDKASALVVEALEPEPGDTVLDLAAAPGVKDTLIMQLTENRAMIIAVDISWERLRRTQRLLKMYGVDLSKVHLVQADSTQAALLAKPTKILIDAPCTSSGAIGKDPAIKIHLASTEWLYTHTPVQRAMLAVGVSYRAPIVVYATCSVLPEEGEEQVEAYADHLVQPPIPGSTGYKAYPVASSVKRLFPHNHRSQGFFIARLELE